MFIVTKKIDSENISKVCRTCLREDNDKMLYLFVGPPESSLGAKLQSLSYLKVFQGDRLPERMCDKCVIRAESALLFREQCQAADRALRQALMTTASDYSINTYTPKSSTSQIYNQQNPSFDTLQNSFSCSSSSSSSSSSTFLSSKSKLSDCKSIKDYQKCHEQNQFFNQALHPIDTSLPQQMHVTMSCSTGYHDSNYLNNQQTFVNETSITKPNNFNHSMLKHNSKKESDKIILNDKIHLDWNCDTQLDGLNFAAKVNKNYSKETEAADALLVSPKISKILDDTGGSLEINQSIFKCEICLVNFNKKTKLISHQATHACKRSFQCIYCSKLYSSKSKLAAHVRLHTQTNVHQCNICKKLFSYPSYLRDHMKTHLSKQTSQTTFECAECKKVFRHAKSYKKHLKFHTGKDLYRCDICDKLFDRKYSLKIHIRSHEKIKMYKCDICGDKSFNQKSNLVEHTRTHTKVKPYKCKICEKSFVQSSHLKSHQASHNSIRLFQCRVCGEKFKLSSHLKRHENSHTAYKIHKCDQCNQMFSQAFSLKRHLKKKHYHCVYLI